MKNFKLILYGIYFILLDTNKMSYKDNAGYGNIFYFVSLIFVLFSIIQDLYELNKRFNTK